MESIINYLNYQPLCSEMECGPMELSGIRMIHIFMIILIAWMLIYTFIEGIKKGYND